METSTAQRQICRLEEEEKAYRDRLDFIERKIAEMGRAFLYEFGGLARESSLRRDKVMTWSAGRPCGNREVKRNT